MFTFPIGVLKGDTGIPIPTDGLVGQWLMSNNLLDTSGNGFNGTLATPTFINDRNGNPNSALSLDGTETVALPDMSLSTGTNLTLCGWFKTSSANSMRIISFDANSGAAQTFIRMTSTHGNVFSRGIAAETTQIVGVPAHNDNTWRFMVGTINASNRLLELFVNNSSEGATTPTTAFTNTAYDNYALGNYSIGGQGFIGGIDDLRVYNRVLNSEELTALANE